MDLLKITGLAKGRVCTEIPIFCQWILLHATLPEVAYCELLKSGEYLYSQGFLACPHSSFYALDKKRGAFVNPNPSFLPPRSTLDSALHIDVEMSRKELERTVRSTVGF